VLCEGNLIEGLRTLIGRFLDLVPNPFALDPSTLQREAHPPEYPALREALVNLLIHQDYSDQQRTARVLWYADRTLFDNPGDSFVTVPEMLDGGASDLRNPRLARLMRQIGFAEQAGTGVPTIIRTWRQVERTPPVVLNDPGRKTYRLILSWDRVPKREDAFWKTRLGASVSPDEARILDWLRHAGVAERAAARMATGATARATLQMVEHLLVNGLLESVDEASDYVRIAPHIAGILDAIADSEQPSEQADEQVTPQVTHQVTPQVARLLGSFQGAMPRAALMEALALTDRMHFSREYLAPALDAGFVEMTIPDKPNSSRQQYRLTDAGRTLLATLPGIRS
jgi:ATP-dependent DNA helicase RecG